MMREMVTESGIAISRICNFFKFSEEELKAAYSQRSLDTELLLKWSKLLDYDFFRIYTQHLILYAPPSAEQKDKKKQTSLPKFRKNIYTQEIINFVLEQIESGKMSKPQVIEKYGIPKTTLYKWISKFKNLSNI